MNGLYLKKINSYQLFIYNYLPFIFVLHNMSSGKTKVAGWGVKGEGFVLADGKLCLENAHAASQKYSAFVDWAEETLGIDVDAGVPADDELIAAALEAVDLSTPQTILDLRNALNACSVDVDITTTARVGASSRTRASRNIRFEAASWTRNN